MGEKIGSGGRGITRRRGAAGLLLLFLTAHAFVASATHFHRLPRAAADSARTALQGREGGGRGVPLAGDDAQCLVCRLQRNFASGLQHAVVSVAPLRLEALNFEPPQSIPARASCAFLRPGRAPPQS